eukprot:scaffold314035_cov13-Prasinocladus_malaysianus.AAC.1
MRPGSYQFTVLGRFAKPPAVNQNARYSVSSRDIRRTFLIRFSALGCNTPAAGKAATILCRVRVWYDTYMYE